MSDIKISETNKSTNTNNNKKASKPFCSLAYLAKSTIAINNPNDIRIVNGHNSNSSHSQSSHTNNNCQPTTPNVAATAKVNERGSPSLPTGANTGHNGHSPHPAAPHTHNGHQPNSCSSHSNTCPDYKHTTNGHSSVADVFGIINEEDMESCCDHVDGEMSNDLRRPWELTNGSYVKRVPSSLMTNGHNGHLSNGLPSLSKLNSLDCWDYTIELECLKGPQGNIL